MSRALRVTKTSKIQTVYSDFSTNLDLNPITDQIVRLTNEAAVESALKAMILTNIGERHYHPEIGSRIQAGLFEMNDAQQIDEIRTTIAETIRTCDPRVKVESLQVEPDPQRDGVLVQLQFSLINIPQIYNTSLFIKRTR